MPQPSSVRNLRFPVHPSTVSACLCIARVRWAGAVLFTLLGLLGTSSWAVDDGRSRATLRGSGECRCSLKTSILPWNAPASRGSSFRRTLSRACVNSAFVFLPPTSSIKSQEDQFCLLLCTRSGTQTLSFMFVPNYTKKFYSNIPPYGVRRYHMECPRSLRDSRQANISHIRDNVRDHIDQFIHAYRASTRVPLAGPRMPHPKHPNRHSGRASAYASRPGFTGIPIGMLVRSIGRLLRRPGA